MEKELLRKIDLTRGTGDADANAAFNDDVMEANAIDKAEFTQALYEALLPFAALLNDGHGVALIRQGEKGRIIGIELADREA